MAGDDNVVPFPVPGEPSSSKAKGAPQFGVPDVMPFFAGAGHPFAPPTQKLLRKRPTRAALIVRLDLDDARPPIWRRLRLASDLPLSQLHDVIQTAMGWEDCHLHHFVMGPTSRDLRKQPFLGPFDIEEGEQGIAETDVRLDQVVSKPGHRLFYEYDFGDSWWHTIKLEKVEPWPEDGPDAFCLDGKRACPPEDIGGIWGYLELLDCLAGRTDGTDPEHVKMMLDWLPPDYDPASFSVDEVNDALLDGPSSGLNELHPMVASLLAKGLTRPPLELMELINRVADRASDEDECLTDAHITALVSGYRLLIELIGDGLTLTQAGYLPPRVVEQLFTQLGMTSEWIGKGNREDQTLPVLELRESATRLGLIRKSRGRLTVTTNGRKVADEPVALLRFIASRLPLGKAHENDAGVLALLFMAAGEQWRESVDKAAELMEWLGWRVDGDAMSEAVNEWSSPTRGVLYSLAGRISPAQRKSAAALELLRSSASTA